MIAQFGSVNLEVHTTYYRKKRKEKEKKRKENLKKDAGWRCAKAGY